MRYGYDLHNPLDREMIMKMHEKQLKRMFSKDITAQQGFIEILKEQQEEYKYFEEREKRENEMYKDIEKQIEEQIPKVIDRELEKLFK